MPHRKIANWTTIRNMCRHRFAAQTAEELEMQAVELARQHAEDKVAAFEREGEVDQAAMVRVVKDASAVAANVAVGKMHAAVARKAVEAVTMEAAMAAMRAMHNDPAMVSLEAMAMEAAKVAVRELRDGVVTRKASVEAQMYGDDATDEESRVAAMAVVTVGTTARLLLDGDETEVEDDDDDEEAEAERDAELRRRSMSLRRRRSAPSRLRLRSVRRWRSAPRTRRPRWTSPSPTGGTSIGGTSIGGRLPTASRLGRALCGTGFCAARTPPSVPRWRLRRAAIEAPCSREASRLAMSGRRRRRRRLTTGM
jgi:hypothetical protein